MRDKRQTNKEDKDTQPMRCIAMDAGWMSFATVCLMIGLSMSFPRYLFKGKNSLGSTHVKQTPHNPDMMWASNTYLIVFQGRCWHSPFRGRLWHCCAGRSTWRRWPWSRRNQRSRSLHDFKRPADASTYISQNTIQYMNTTRQTKILIVWWSRSQKLSWEWKSVFLLRIEDSSLANAVVTASGHCAGQLMNTRVASLL